jgi:hypothetical protein
LSTKQTKELTKKSIRIGPIISTGAVLAHSEDNRIRRDEEVEASMALLAAGVEHVAACSVAAEEVAASQKGREAQVEAA